MALRRQLRGFLALAVTAAAVLVFPTGTAHASEPKGFGLAITAVSGTNTHALDWHGSYSCSHSTDAVLVVTAVDQLSGLTVSTTPQLLSCPAMGTPMHGSVTAPGNWGNSVRITAVMTDLVSGDDAELTLGVTNDIAEVVTVDDLVVNSDGTVTYSGKFSCLTADDDAYLDIELTQVPHGGTATGAKDIEIICPATPGSLAGWEATVSSLTGPFEHRGILRNIYVLHPGSVSGDDDKGDDCEKGDDDCPEDPDS